MVIFETKPYKKNKKKKKKERKKDVEIVQATLCLDSPTMFGPFVVHDVWNLTLGNKVCCGVNRRKRILRNYSWGASVVSSYGVGRDVSGSWGTPLG